MVKIVNIFSQALLSTPSSPDPRYTTMKRYLWGAGVYVINNINNKDIIVGVRQ